MSHVTPPEEIEAKVEGTPLGVVGRLTATATTRLAEAGGETVIRYAIDATLTGKLGSMGQPVLKAKAKEMEKQFTARLAAAFAGGAGVAAMTPFELVEPASLKEAIALIDPDDPDVRPIAGGTALMLMMKAGVFRPQPPGQLAQTGRCIHPHRRGAVRRTDHRRAGAAQRARAFARGRTPRAGDRAHHAAAVKCARAQCRDRRRRAGACAIRTWICRRC